MIKNYFFLIAALWALLGSVVHASVGHSAILTQIDRPDVNYAVFLLLHQTTWFMVLSAVLFALGATARSSWNIVPAAWMILTAFAGNYVMYLLAGMVKRNIVLMELVPQTLYAAIYLLLIYQGIKKAGVLRANSVH